MSSRETVPEKAKRLTESFRVLILVDKRDPLEIDAEVIGDHDSYTVRFRPHGLFCQCTWFRLRGHVKPCSHILAVRRALDYPESQKPVRRLVERLRGAQKR